MVLSALVTETFLFAWAESSGVVTPAACALVTTVFISTPETPEVWMLCLITLLSVSLSGSMITNPGVALNLD